MDRWIAIALSPPQISPNKTWEGLAGGVGASVATMICAALLMKWPFPLASGAVYGLTLALMGLVGDLTVSLLKRYVFNIKEVAPP